MRAAQLGRGGAGVLRREDSLLLVTSRAPVTFARRGARLRFDRGAGGVVTALSHLSRATPVTWIAATAGSEDREVAAAQRERGGVLGSGRLTLRLLDIPEELFADFYGAFSNRILWFVQHGLWSRRVDPEPAQRVRALARRYLEATRVFADAVSLEAHRPERSVAVMSHDYQLYALPRLVRERLPGLPLAHFVHIPWPRLEVWRRAVPDDVLATLLRGALGADVLGFQDEGSRREFAACAGALLPEAETDGERLTHGGRRTLLRVRPVSIDPRDLRPSEARARALREDPRVLVVRVDRVDPIKNVPRGFRAFGQLLERRPDLAGRVRFVARVVPSRVQLPEYAREWDEATAAAGAVNARHGPGTVEIVKRPDRGRALAELRAADVVLVNSVADGMNLVAKEAAVLNPRAAIVLSRAAGAYAELAEGAIGIDPLSVEDTASALERAIDMPDEERRRRAGLMREAVLRWTSRDWMRALMSDLGEAAEQAATERIRGNPRAF